MITIGEATQKSSTERMDEWMERLFKREPQISPARAATLCILYSGSSMNMKLILKFRAQRIKKRVLAEFHTNLAS